MKGFKLKIFSLIFLFCFALSSCELTENILKKNTEVDFQSPQKVQISFNEYIYDATISLDNKDFEMVLTNKNALLKGARIFINESHYELSYMDMIFNGEKSELVSTFFPLIIYNFLSSFENEVILNAFNEERGCFFLKKEINSYFVTLECYENDNNINYSIEIK